MIKAMLISIVIMWTIAFLLPYVLKIVKHRKDKGNNDVDKP